METSERNIEANMNELIGRIEAKYDKMSKGQKRLAEYVKENYDKAVFLTAARLGEIVGVSESTVVRFATQLGYRGYPEFQKALEELVRNKLNSTDHSNRGRRCDHWNQFPKILDENIEST